MATDRLAEARRLSNEATKAAQEAAAAAQHEADRLTVRSKQVGKTESLAPRTTARPATTRPSRAKTGVATKTKTTTQPKAQTKTQQTAQRLNAMTKQDLLSLAATQGVEGRSNMTKAELVKALR